MNIHQLIDNLTVNIASLVVGKNKFLAKSIKSLTFNHYFENISLNLPTIKEEGKYEIKVDTLHGRLNPAFFIVQWKGINCPTVIYHHGNNERPFNFSRFSKNSFKDIFIKHNLIDANLIAVRAPFHKGSFRKYKEKMSYLSNFVIMLATSVIVVEGLIKFINQNWNSSIAVSGISLGGWVTNLHKTYYNTADVYIPLLAGAALGDLFLTSNYKKVTGELAKKNSNLIRRILNFEDDFKKQNHDNIYPLLGKYDQYIQYDKQRGYYQNRKINVLEKGHVTTLLASNELYKHITESLTTII